MDPTEVLIAGFALYFLYVCLSLHVHGSARDAYTISKAFVCSAQEAVRDRAREGTYGTAARHLVVIVDHAARAHEHFCRRETLELLMRQMIYN